jgi:EmrB/QacA subfamily drug resistance transporter
MESDNGIQTARTRVVHTFLVLLCTSMPACMLQLDNNIISVSLPAIGRSLGASFAGIEWVITAYLVSFASFLLPAGALSDRFGRKEVLMTGLSIFSLASLVCGWSGDLAVIIGARAVQGAGGAMMISGSLAALSHAFQGETRARAFAFWGSVIGIGMAAGPVIGGLITESLGWQWAFCVNPPIGAALIALTAKFVETSKDPAAARLDLPGVLCFGSALFLATFALIEGNHRGWANFSVRAELVSSLVLFVLFVIVELHQRHAMVDLSYFRKPSYLGANLAQFGFSAGMMTMLTLVPLFLQNGLAHGARDAGLMMLPMVLPLFLVPKFVTSHLTQRFSGRGTLTIGLLSLLVGLLILAFVVAQRSYMPLIAGMILMGVGGGILNSESTKVGMSLIPKERAGMASGIASTVRFAAIVIGVAALSAVAYGKVASIVATLLPELGPQDQLHLVGEIMAGHLTHAHQANAGLVQYQELALSSFARGYRALFLAAACLMLIVTVLTWFLVAAADTPPIPAPSLARKPA